MIWWDYDKEYRQDCILDEKGENIDISTPEKLYDYLVSEYEKQILNTNADVGAKCLVQATE